MAEHEIRGKTEDDVKMKFNEWQKENASKVRNVRCRAITQLSLRSQQGELTPPYRPFDFEDQCSMIIEYDAD
jgi:hypothetical protein